MVGVTGDDDDKGEEPPATIPSSPTTMSPNTIPTLSPNTSPTIKPPDNEAQRLIAIRNIVSYLSLDQSNALLDPSTPQYQALRWISYMDKANIDLSDMDRIITRYALTVLYLATDGYNSWDDEIAFASTSLHECDWNSVSPTGRGVKCDLSMNVIIL